MDKSPFVHGFARNTFWTKGSVWTKVRTLARRRGWPDGQPIKDSRAAGSGLDVGFDQFLILEGFPNGVVVAAGPAVFAGDVAVWHPGVAAFAAPIQQRGDDGLAALFEVVFVEVLAEHEDRPQDGVLDESACPFGKPVILSLPARIRGAGGIGQGAGLREAGVSAIGRRRGRSCRRSEKDWGSAAEVP